MPDLSFVYPIYNEIENLPRLIPRTRQIAEGLIDDYEVILVDDGSNDGSSRFIDGLSEDFPEVLVCHHPQNRGLGAALSTGFAHASKNAVLYMDSDFPVSVEDARAAICQFEPDVDLLAGYRIGSRGVFWRKLLSWSYNTLSHLTLNVPVRDVNFAFKIIRRPLLRRVRLRSEGAFVDAELLLEATRLKANIRETGIRQRPRTAGRSKGATWPVVRGVVVDMWRYGRSSKRDVAHQRTLVVNADDFGLCPEVNSGVVRAFDSGIVRSASVLPTGRHFEEAADLARARPGLDLGVHLSLTNTGPLLARTLVTSLVDSSGRFPTSWATVAFRCFCCAIRKDQVEAEFRAQIERVLQENIDVSHLDSDQHVHLLPHILPIVVRLAKEYGIRVVRLPRQTKGARPGRPSLAGLERRVLKIALTTLSRRGARLASRHELLVPDGFRGFTEAGAWDSTSLAGAVADLGRGITEISCHPATSNSVNERFPWGYDWERELAALTSAEVREAVRENGVRLSSFREAAQPAGEGGEEALKLRRHAKRVSRWHQD